MSSNSLLSNKAFNRLSVNRLDAQAIRSDNISSANPSFLYSILFKFATFTRNNTGGKLIINVDQKFDSVIQFSDRPFRQQKTITLYDFILLFLNNQQNSFSQDPPNAVLSHQLEQRTYKMTFDSITDKQLVYNMDLLPGETHDMSEVSGRMSLFVDNGDDVLDVAGPVGIVATVGQGQALVGEADMFAAEIDAAVKEEMVRVGVMEVARAWKAEPAEDQLRVIQVADGVVVDLFPAEIQLEVPLDFI